MRSVERFPSPGRESHADDVRQRLRGLPAERQAPYDWVEFRRRERNRAWPRRHGVRWGHAAAAAGITAMIASLAFWGSADNRPVRFMPHDVASVPQSASNTPAPQGEAAGGADLNAQINERFNAAANQRAQAMSMAAQAAVAAQLAALARTQASKRWLEHHSGEPALVRVGPRLAVANLEDRIAWVDDALTDAQFASVNTGRMHALEQERARLVSSLAQVRYAETLVAQTP
jgi:hypothetical protein